MSAIFARLTADGTAIGESALCQTCLPDADLTRFDAADSATDHVDCSGNDCLSCGRCGLVL